MLLQLREPNAPQDSTLKDIPVAVGIDLGTTHSLVAYQGATGAVRYLTDLMPSVVSYRDDNPLVGADALAHIDDHPDAVAVSIKRWMRGDELPHAIYHNNRPLSAPEISSDILKALKKQAEKTLQQQITQAVITVPAYFDDAARTATKDAARLAGLEVLRLVNEPTAAALAYGLDSDQEGVYGIFDLGGGTFDFSILNLHQGVFQVKATNGDGDLGGDDLDQALLSHFDLPLTKANLQEAKGVKELLSTQYQGTLAGHLVTRTLLESLADPWISRALTLCQETLTHAGLALRDLKGIVLVGGSTHMPLVKERAAAYFHQTPITGIDPDRIVAHGAALQAHALTHGSDTLLMDVTPLSLGLEIMGGMVDRIIERNSPIPLSKAKNFTTYQDGQTGLLLHIVQGEREMVDQCRSLGTFKLMGIPPMVAGAPRIEVIFQVDADGLLTVSATEETTGISQSIEVKPTYGIAEEEMKNMILASLHHAKEDVTRRLLTESKIEAKRFLESLLPALATDRALLNDDEYAVILSHLDHVDQVLGESDRDAIDAAVHHLENLTEPFAERRMTRSIKKALEGKTLSAVEKALEI